MADKNKEPKEPQAPEVVSVPKAEWDKIVAGLASLTKDNEMLKTIADKGRLAAFEARQEQPATSIVKLSTYEHIGERKIVLAWQMTKDRVYKAANGAWVEEQEVTVTLEGDIHVLLSLADFYRLTANKEKAEIVETTNENGSQVFKVHTATGKELMIAAQFVN